MSSFVDTLEVFKVWKPNLVGGHGLKNLANKSLGPFHDFDAYNAVADANV